VGVVGTFSTIQSNAYTKMFKKLGSGCFVKEVPCPLFVPIIEEGWADTAIAKNIAETYLKEFQDCNIDTLILGCTHYPIMANTIQDVLSNHIELIYSGKTVGIKLKKYLKNQNCENSSNTSQSVKYFVTDFPQKFDELGSRFLGRPLNNVTHIPIV
jgi:glutamate racemase